MATNATGTPTSPDSIARIVPADQPDMSSLTGGVNAIADTTQTALTNNYPRLSGAKSTNHGLVWNGSVWVPQFIANATIASGAAIAVDKLAAGSSNTVLRGGASNSFGQVQGADIVTSAALAGSPTTTTQAQDNNSTAIATTAYVTNQAAASVTGLGLAGVVGTSQRYARQDHVHVVPTAVSNTYAGAYGSEQGVTSGLGDGFTYYCADPPQQFSSGAFPSTYWLLPMDWTSRVAMGGTVQWRVTFAFTQASGAIGGSGRSVLVQYQPWPLGTGTVAAGVTMINSSWADGNGVKTFDSGYLTAPTGDGGGLCAYAFTFQTNRVGGVVRDIQRVRLDVQVRNV